MSVQHTRNPLDTGHTRGASRRAGTGLLTRLDSKQEHLEVSGEEEEEEEGRGRRRAEEVEEEEEEEEEEAVLSSSSSFGDLGDLFFGMYYHHHHHHLLGISGISSSGCIIIIGMDRDGLGRIGVDRAVSLLGFFSYYSPAPSPALEAFILSSFGEDGTNI